MTFQANISLPLQLAAHMAAANIKKHDPRIVCILAGQIIGVLTVRSIDQRVLMTV